jgi:hypothetical protein
MADESNFDKIASFFNKKNKKISNSDLAKKKIDILIDWQEKLVAEDIIKKNIVDTVKMANQPFNEETIKKMIYYLVHSLFEGEHDRNFYDHIKRECYRNRKGFDDNKILELIIDTFYYQKKVREIIQKKIERIYSSVVEQVKYYERKLYIPPSLIKNEKTKKQKNIGDRNQNRNNTKNKHANLIIYPEIKILQ